MFIFFAVGCAAVGAEYEARGDWREAASYWTLGAAGKMETRREDVAECCYKLGCCRMFGLNAGLSFDAEEALTLWKRAAKDGGLEMARSAPILLRRGGGCARMIPFAMELELTTLSDCYAVCYVLGRNSIRVNKRAYNAALTELRRRARLREPRAIVTLAMLYEDGFIHPRQPTNTAVAGRLIAQRLYFAAAALGHLEAIMWCALRLDSQGDLSAARKMAHRATVQGDVRTLVIWGLFV